LDGTTAATASPAGPAGRVLYLRQHAAQRHSMETPPLGSLRRVKRHPNEVLMSV
jgi:hypothetical protein